MKKSSINKILTTLTQQSNKQKNLTCLVTDTTGSSTIINFDTDLWSTGGEDFLCIQRESMTVWIDTDHIVSITC